MTAHQILGVSETASDEEIRAAYLAKVKEFPPERAAEQFEAIRDAYNHLRDPRQRAKTALLAGGVPSSFVSLADGLKPRRLFAGPQAWREVLKGK
jgi:curved DNA-binding protein CbpA